MDELTMTLRHAAAGLFLSALLEGPLAAQVPSPPPPIQDNSFLIEEAYNQERGVVQHISLFARARDGSWAYTFTQEWPFRGRRHQLSYTLPWLRPDGTDGASGPGDVALNYRLQIPAARGIWMAPRLSVVLPTGNFDGGRGEGVVGGQLALPMSLELSDRFAAHLNGGITLHPHARNGNDEHATLAAYSAGASLIFLAMPTVNLMLESVVEVRPEITGPGTTSHETLVFVGPGIRWAHNFASGLQIVPGLAYARGLGDASRESRLLVYLSLEHSFKR